MKTKRILILLYGLMLIASAFPAMDTELQTGTVTKVIAVDSYIYLELGNRGEETWLATKPVKVSPGDVIEYANGTLMQDFYSKSLERTFGSLLFVSRINIVSREGTDAIAEEIMQARSPDTSKSVIVIEPSPGEIAPLAGGKTVEDIIMEYQQLNGQQVSLRARVMKVSENVLEKNWVTLQDGTGTPPGNKLVATTSETITPGELVIVTGLVKTDVSLGYGYDYKVLLEKAGFSR